MVVEMVGEMVGQVVEMAVGMVGEMVVEMMSVMVGEKPDDTVDQMHTERENLWALRTEEEMTDKKADVKMADEEADKMAVLKADEMAVVKADEMVDEKADEMMKEIDVMAKLRADNSNSGCEQGRGN